MYYLLLQQHRESLAKLQERWPTPLASTICYTSHACTALMTASSIAGTAAPLEVQWLPPVLCNISVDTFTEDPGLPLVDFDPVEPILDADQIALEDVLKEHSNADGDDPCDIEAKKNVHSAELIWTIPSISSIQVYPFLFRNIVPADPCG